MVLVGKYVLACVSNSRQIDPHLEELIILLLCTDHGLYKEIDDNFRVKYAGLWKSLMLADLQGIEESCHALGIDKAYPLFASN